MSIRDNLIRARSHIVFLIGLTTAFGVVITLDRLELETKPTNYLEVEKTKDTVLPSPTPLTDEEIQWAKIAWTYFQNNTQTATGLVNSVDGYPSTTLWDTSSYLLATIAAERLGIITTKEFDQRITQALESLASITLFNNQLPNKAYDTRSLAMVDYNNQPSDKGIGWSAIDIGRVLSPLNILIWNYPTHTAEVKRVIAAWDFEALLKDGALQGAALDEDKTIQKVQEGRLGYEEYAAKSLSLLGFDVSRAMFYGDHLKYINIYDIEVPTDSRIPERYHAHNYVVSEPYILDGLEYGWDNTSSEFAFRVYRAQEERHKRTGLLTAVSEDNIDQAPYFVYNTVFTSGKPWNTITEKGEDASAFRSLSTKAAIGWHMLYRTSYTEKLAQAVASLNDPKKGWYSGRYELTGKPNMAITANTNGIILQSLAYRVFGPMVRPYTETRN